MHVFTVIFPDSTLIETRGRKPKHEYDNVWWRTAIWNAANPDRIIAKSNKRRANKLLAVPKWADLEGIRLFYWLSKQMNRVIDHIVPLTHPLVCGLHTMENLQMLTRAENSRKSNTFVPG